MDILLGHQDRCDGSGCSNTVLFMTDGVSSMTQCDYDTILQKARAAEASEIRTAATTTTSSLPLPAPPVPLWREWCLRRGLKSHAAPTPPLRARVRRCPRNRVDRALACSGHRRLDRT